MGEAVGGEVAGGDGVAFDAFDELAVVVVGGGDGDHDLVYAVDEVEVGEHLGEALLVVDAATGGLGAGDDVEVDGDVGGVYVVGELLDVVLAELDEDGGDGPGCLGLYGGEVLVPEVDVGDAGDVLFDLGGDGKEEGFAHFFLRFLGYEVSWKGRCNACLMLA